MIKKVLLTIFTIFILIIINCNIIKSYAVESYGCTLIVESNKKTIKKGEEITLTIKASDINAGNGIVMFSTIIEFDENDFSFANQNEIVSAQGWSNFARIDNSITFYRSDYLPNSENQEIGKVKLIAKNDITAGDKAITFTSNEFVIEVSEGQENTLNIDNLGLSIKVEDENHSGNDNTTNDNTTSDDTIYTGRKDYCPYYPPLSSSKRECTFPVAFRNSLKAFLSCPHDCREVHHDERHRACKKRGAERAELHEDEHTYKAVYD